jgi:hypothetical protein
MSDNFITRLRERGWKADRDEAADLIERLTSSRDALFIQVRQADVRGDEAMHRAHDAEAERDALRKDAERWRKFRLMVRGERHIGTGHNQGFAFPSRFDLPPLADIMRGSVAQHLDAAIDAAKAAP